VPLPPLFLSYSIFETNKMDIETINTRVLIIDDEEIVRDSIEDILIPHYLQKNEQMASAANILFDDGADGDVIIQTRNSHIPLFTVDQANNGMDGVSKVKKAITDNSPYAVIFLDMRMPGWDGLETAIRIREVDIKAEIIIVTAYSDKSIEEIISKAGQNIGYHCKPYASEEILQLATKAVNDYNKLRNLETLISVISNISVSETHLNSLLQNILDQLAMYIGSDTAIIGKLLPNSQYQKLFSIGAIEENININKIAELISSTNINNEEVKQIDEIVFIKLDDYSIFAVLSKELHLKTEKLYLVKLFIQNAARAIKNMQLHEELSKKEKLSAVGKAIGMLMHDLRVPIKSIPTFTAFIRDEGCNSEWLEMIDQCEEQASEIFDDFMDFLRETPLISQPFALDKLITEGINSSKGRLDNKDLLIKQEMEPGIILRGDYNKLKRAIINLVVNAGEALLEHKTQNPEIVVLAKKSDNHVVITVKDNGPGIPEKIMGNLFDAFITENKSSGTGLGLAIVKQYVVAHNGTIAAANNNGAQFTMLLPIGE
jgi:two-component system, NtrC family, sensor kinase